jgi:hypothetical protein
MLSVGLAKIGELLSISFPLSTNSQEPENQNDLEYKKYLSNEKRPTGWYLYCVDQKVYWGPSCCKLVSTESVEFANKECGSKHTSSYHLGL